jgi:hypothetical protein
MNRLVLVALLALAGVSVTHAQDNRTPSSQLNDNVAADFTNTSAATPSLKFTDGLYSPKGAAVRERIVIC